MFLLIPWRVDVPQDRWPVMNWLILLTLVAVFALQIHDYDENLPPRDSWPIVARPGDSHHGTRAGQSPERVPPSMSEVPGITHDLILRGWGLKGLFGYMWLHASLRHLLGNLLFLWIFGNALCAKLGNVRYLALYVFFGVLAGAAQVLGHALPALGASGAINGVVGAYVFLFFENEITCLFACWFLFFYVRWFAVSSIWMVLFWLLRDVAGAFLGGGHVGYFAHLGGFAAGFGIALLMCHKGWITMERYEKSLLQLWQERRRDSQAQAPDAAYAQFGLERTDEERQQTTATLPPSGGPAAFPPPPEPGSTPTHAGPEGFIRTACPCGYSIRAPQKYAGRTVRCPRCRQPVVIPDKTNVFGPAPSLAPLPSSPPQKVKDRCIHFICPCGKKLKAPAPYAGRTIQCPHCRAKLKIPTLAP